MPRFEAHLTFPRLEHDIVKDVADSTSWSFSAIDGDPVMGKQAYCYLTGYSDSGKALQLSLQFVATVAKAKGATLLRSKIERILIDSKTGWTDKEGW